MAPQESYDPTQPIQIIQQCPQWGPFTERYVRSQFHDDHEFRVICQIALRTVSSDAAPWRKPGPLRALLDLVDSVGLWFGGALKPSPSPSPSMRSIPMDSIGQFVTEIIQRDTQARLSLQTGEFPWSSDPLSFNTTYLTLQIQDCDLDLRIEFEVEESPTILARCCDLMGRIYRACRAYSATITSSHVAIEGLETLRPRPVRDLGVWGCDQVVDGIDMEDAARRSTLSAPQIDVLVSAPLSSDAARILDEGLLLLRWCEALNSPAEAQIAMIERERWLGNNLALPIHPEFNERGDRRLDTSGCQAHPELLMVDPAQFRGFREAPPNLLGKGPLPLFRDMKGLWRADHLPKRRKWLEELILIFPSRQGAIDFQLKAQKTLSWQYRLRSAYRDEKGDLLEPLSRWVEPPQEMNFGGRG